jgi:predicted acylesterase/phospholipase RssA
MHKIFVGAAVLGGLIVTACGQPRTVAQQGPICESMAKYGQLPVGYPDITPVELKAEHARQLTRHFARRSYGGAVGATAAPEPAAVSALPGAKAADFRAKIAAQAAAKRALPEVRGGYGAAPGAIPEAVGASAGPEPLRILSVSAGGSWGAFSIGFLEGWGEGSGPDRRPKFDVVTGVSTGSMIAVAMFLGDPTVIAKVRTLYANLKESDVYTQRSALTVLSSTSLFDSAPLRAKLDALLTDSMVEAIAAENGHRMLAVMATNLDSGAPEPFDLTAIAANPKLTPAQRHDAIVSALMASSAEPVAFPPEMIGGNLYVDGGVRLHVFFVNEVKVALAEQGQVQPIDLTVVVSGDMAITRDCTGTGSTGLGLISVVGRTASVAIDQLLVNSVQALMAVGLQPGNQARMINARRLIDYGAKELPPGTPPPGPCKISDAQFDPVFEGCLVRNGTDMGRAQPIKWNIEVAGSAGGRPPRISALQ